ncbi:MAG: aspartyl protease family protein [Mucilaginibacter sp.]|nr:aspartyl protease family protein [Mucilaginibacter sp.]
MKILLHKKDTCLIKIASTLPPDLPESNLADIGKAAVSFPFELRGSKIYITGKLNERKVNIQFDLGAGTSAVNRNASGKLGLVFSGQTTVSNTAGVNSERTSAGNVVAIGDIKWTDVPMTEVSNMQPHEDIIIGNSFFRGHMISVDYDAMQITVYRVLPKKLKRYQKLPIFYEQDRPKFKAKFTQGGRRFSFWFLFDTGRDGTMLLGEDFTATGNHWELLDPLTMIGGRKIVRLDADIAGVHFRDLVTNAADPAKPNGRPSLFGNQILSHFNFILDNVNGFLYLKQNGRAGEPYFNYDRYLEVMQKKKSND